MTASWKLIGQTADDRAVELNWSDRSGATVKAIIKVDEAEIERREFADLGLADVWAMSLGIRRWMAATSHNCFPLASLIEIDFPDSPAKSSLIDALADLKRGESLRAVAMKLGAHPACVRAWLIGIAPLDEKLGQLRPR